MCACGHAFSVNHAMDCRTGGFPTRRHNEIRDITAEIMSEVCYNVMIEPQLQSLSGETFRRKTTKTEDNAHLDISADAFWGTEKQRAFFDVRIFNPNAPSYQNANLDAIYQRQEKEKRRSYEERVTEVEMGSFTPLVFAITGGMGKSTTIAYKRLASLLATKRQQPYGLTMAWLRCRLGFSLLRSAITAIRGARSTAGQPAKCSAIDLAVSEGNLI